MKVNIGWLTVAFWISTAVAGVDLLVEAHREYQKKCPEVPVLDDYRARPGAKFWEKFPKNRRVENLSCKIDVDLLNKKIDECWAFWSGTQKNVARKTLDNLRNGAETKLSKTLPAQKCKNTPSSFEHGEFVTDVLAHWVKTGVVAGPFSREELGENFRSNPLMAIAQKNKVRLVLNLSAPKGASFNDSVDELHLPKLKMSSARKFGAAVRIAGKNATISKQDIRDAYKLIPGAKNQWPLFGFSWLGKFFFDTTTVFGSKSAPANFDCLPETLVNIVGTVEKIPKGIVFRQLDDVPTVSASGSGWTEKFASAYAELCGQVGIPLAEECPKKEKAFGPSKTGVVLGIKFDTKNQTWALPEEKLNDTLSLVENFLAAKTCTLKQAQKIAGKLGHVAQMCDFMMGFRFNLFKLIRDFNNRENEKRLITGALKNDLQIWKKCLLSAAKGLPIPALSGGAPISAIKFVSDAAGAAYEWAEGNWVNKTEPGDRGVASIGFDGENIFFAGGLRWPFELLTKKRDSKGVLMGGKSTMLECVGLLLPFICAPEAVRGKFVRLKVDNHNLTHVWAKKYCKEDAETSVLIRCLHVIETYLDCKIFIEFTKRMSTPMAALADRLSRESTTTNEDLARIRHVKWNSPHGPLEDWLKDPTLDWNLPVKMLNHYFKTNIK